MTKHVFQASRGDDERPWQKNNPIQKKIEDGIFYLKPYLAFDKHFSKAYFTKLRL